MVVKLVPDRFTAGFMWSVDVANLLIDLCLSCD